MNNHSTTLPINKNLLYNHSKFIFFLMIVVLFFAGTLIASSQILQRGAATTNAATFTGTGRAITINKPTGVIAGDILIASIIQNETDNDNGGLSNISTSGWSLITGGLIRSDGTGNGDNAWWGTYLYRIADGTEGTSFSFALPNDRADMAIGTIVAFSGVAVSGGVLPNGTGTGPFDVASSSFTIGNNTNPTVSAITTVTPNAAVILLAQVNDDNTFSNWVDGSASLVLGELYNSQTTNGDDAGMGAAWGVMSSAGSTGTCEVDMSGSDRWGAILIALRPGPSITSFTPTSGCSGSTVTITGANLTGATSVNIGGTAVSSITSNTATQIIAVVGAGTTGNITITTAGGTATSASGFTVTPNVGTPTFSLGATTTRCQGAGSVTYTATATDNTGLTYSLDAISSAFPGNNIFSSTGVVNYAAGWSGTSTITVSATGCNGPTTATHTVTITPTVGTPVFSLGATSTRCQGAGSVTYTATASDNTGLTYSLDTITLAFPGNSFDSGTGAVTYAAGWSGTSTITVSAAGCNGPTTATHTVTINPIPTAFNVTGTGAYCTGGSGLAVGLDGSETGVNYQLYNGGSPVGSPFAGTGSAISFGLQTGTNTYTVIATNSTTPCTNTMTGNAVITQNTLPNNTTITGFTGGSFCIGNQATLTFDAIDSNGAPPYTLSYTDGTTTFSQSIPTNAATTFNVSTTIDTGYTLLSITDSNGCVNSSPTNYSANIFFRPNPLATISGNTVVCQGDANPNITFTNPQTAGITITYTINGVTAPTVNVVAGTTTVPATTAVPVPTTTAGTFVYDLVSVMYSTNPTCTQPLSGSVTVIVTPTNTVSAASSSPTLCINTALSAAITHTTTGATGIGVPTNLPTGVTATWASNTITISGTPSVAGTFNYSIPLTGGCGSVNATGTITVNPLPVAAGTISGSAVVCQAQNGVSYSVPAITNATGYTWTLPTGATIATGSNTNSITVNFSTSATSGNITVQGTNACGNGIVSANYAVTVNPLPVAAGTISGTPTVCQGQNGVSYSVLAITNASGYSWTLPSGASIASGTNTNAITLNFSTSATSGNITVQGTNACGNGIVSANYAVTVNPLPVAAGTITGTTTVCQGQNGVIYSVPAITNATGYSWTLPSGASIASGTNTNAITLNFSTSATSGNITVQGTNACGNGIISANYAVTVNPLPVAAGTISGSAVVCQGQNGVSYSVPAIANATGYIWTLPFGASIATGSNTNAITVNFSTSATSGNITVQGTNACGNGIISANYAVTVNPLPVAAGTISGAAVVCQGQNGVSYSVPAITNATGYTWTLPTGATIATGSNTNSITVNFSTSATSGNITVQGTNACGNGIVSANYAVTVNPLPVAAGTISGSAVVCQGQNGVSYSVPGITNATGYTWTLPSGATIATGSNTNSITVNFSTSATSGNITVQGTNACGNGIVSANYAVTVNPLPVAAGTISGAAVVCQGQNGVSYSVPANTNATGYTWTLPTGATIATGSNTNSITVNFSTSATSGNITVQGTNACGNGIVSANYAVTVNITPSITLNYSPTVCSGELVTVTPANGGGNIVPPGTTYSWLLPTITGGITGATALSGQTSFNQTLTNPTNTIQTASYNVTATTGGCSATTFSVLVTVYPKPTVSGSPLTQTICSNVAIAPITFSNPNGISGTIDYNWTRDNTANVTGMSASGSGSSITGNLLNATNGPQTTVFTVIATTQNGCNSLPFTVSVVVNPIPTVLATPATNQTICSEGSITPIALSNPNGVTGTTYSWTRSNTVNITGIPDGSGTSISGSLTNTTNIAQTTVFTIKASTNGCDSSTTTISVIVNPKPTVAVSSASQTVCSGTAIVPVTISNPNSVSGTTYSWTRDNTTNLSGMASGTGTTISGTLVNNTNIDQTTIFTVTATVGTCFSTTNTTVIVKPTPTILITPSSQTICNASAITPMNITNPNSVTGTTFTWTRDNTNLTGIAMSGSGNSISGSLTNIVTTTQTTTFTITATAANGCSSTSTATVTVYAPLVAPVISSAQTVCVFSTPATLTSTLPTGGSGSYTYQWQSSPNASGGPWTNVGTSSLTYSPPIVNFGDNDSYYQLVVTNVCGTVISNTISIEVITNVGFTFSLTNTPAGSLCPNSSFTPKISAVHLWTSYVRYLWSADAAFITPATGGPVGTTTFFITSSANIGPLTTINNTNTSIITTISVTPNVYNSSTNAFICSASPTNFNVTIYPKPTATATVPNATICNGSSAAIVVKGNITDATTTLSWTRSVNANVSSTVGSGSNTPVAFGGTYTIPDVLTNTALTSQTVTYTITPSSNGCLGTVITVTITVAPTVNAGTIAANQTICSGESPVAFTQTAAAGAGTLTYQWQSSTIDSAGPYTPISGANAATYTPTGVTVNTWYIRTATYLLSGATPPVVSGVTYTTNSASCSQNTSFISVTINTINPGSVSGDQTICSGGDPVAFGSVAATGTAISYQWQSNITGCGGTWVDIPGATLISGIYDIPSGLTQTTYYRRKVTATLNGKVCTDYSNCIVVYVNDVTAGTLGSDQTICGNNPDAFTVITPATGSGVLSYQWQSNTTSCGGAWSTISGAISATYDPPPGLLVTTYYRRITTSTLNGVPCTVTGNCITVTANSVSPGAISGNRTICSGGDPTAFTETAAATGTGLTYQWQYSLTGGAGPWTDISGATSATYDAPGPITQNTYYQRVVKATVNGTDCYAYSSFVVVFVNDVTPSTVAGNQNLCSNLDPSAFTVPIAAIGTGSLTYQWQSNNTGCGGSWGDISGATSATYDPPTISQTTYFQVVVTSTLNGVSCSIASNCITVISLSKSWNGSVNTDWNTSANWTPNGIPDATNCVIIPNVTNDPVVSTTDAVAYSLTILNGGVLVVNTNSAITVTNIVNVNAGGTFQIENNGSLVQIDNVANTGNIIYKRTADNIKGYDYVYWSSPVSNQSLGGIYTTPTQGPKYEWNTLIPNANGASGNTSQGNWEAATATMITAKGYIVRGSSNYYMAATNINSTFTGVPNNGNIPITVFRGAYTGANYTGANGSTITNLSDNFNLLGNPYPSAISALQFLYDNRLVIEGNVDLWTHGTAPATGVTNPFYGSFSYNYASSYATINYTASTIPPPPGILETIKAGQAFFIKMLDGVTGSATVNFNNVMRDAIYSNSGFFKNSNSNDASLIYENLERHRIWLDIVASNNSSDRAVIGYVTGATLEADHFFDAITVPSGSLDIYSLIDNQTFNIQGRPLPFNDNDIVPLGYKVGTPGSYHIAINTLDGLFETQNIYLEDLSLQIVHDLKLSPYLFTSESGIFNNRFVIRYTNSALGTIDFESSNSVQVIVNEKVSIHSTFENIKDVEVFDLLGRKIGYYKNGSGKEIILDKLRKTMSTLILKIKLENDVIVTRKIIF